jgi:NitT/TauT family transport system permease protein
MNIYVLMFFVIWIGGWWLNVRISKFEAFNLAKFIVPSLFGVVFLFMWELIVIGLSINPVLLPAPSAIASKFSSSLDILWIDFVQTLVKGALSGYILGCGSAFLTAIAIDKFNFLKRGLLPLGNFISALPIVGMAPIFVMWFGFDWQSKCAIVIVMVYFPMLVNSVQGLELIDPSRQDLMRTYNASYTQTLFKLRLPSALPFIFNGLKICSTLALIGAIVAEFFGSPIKGMGFRISSEVGRFALDMVWAEIFVAAMAGCLFYGLIALIERRTTFWHPSQQK